MGSQWDGTANKENPIGIMGLGLGTGSELMGPIWRGLDRLLADGYLEKGI